MRIEMDDGTCTTLVVAIIAVLLMVCMPEIIQHDIDIVNIKASKQIDCIRLGGEPSDCMRDTNAK